MGRCVTPHLKVWLSDASLRWVTGTQGCFPCPPAELELLLLVREAAGKPSYASDSSEERRVDLNTWDRNQVLKTITSLSYRIRPPQGPGDSCEGFVG